MTHRLVTGYHQPDDGEIPNWHVATHLRKGDKVTWVDPKDSRWSPANPLTVDDVWGSTATVPAILGSGGDGFTHGVVYLSGQQGGSYKVLLYETDTGMWVQVRTEQKNELKAFPNTFSLVAESPWRNGTLTEWARNNPDEIEEVIFESPASDYPIRAEFVEFDIVGAPVVAERSASDKRPSSIELEPPRSIESEWVRGFRFGGDD